MSDSEQREGLSGELPATNSDKLMALVDPSIEFSNAMADAWLGVTIAGALVPLAVVLFLGGWRVTANAPSAIIGIFQLGGVAVMGYIAACVAGLLGLGVVSMFRAILKPLLTLRMTLSIFPGVSGCFCVLPIWALPNGNVNPAIILLTVFVVTSAHVVARIFGYRACNAHFRSRVFPATFQIGIATILKLTAAMAFLFALARLIGFNQFYVPFLIYLALQVLLVVGDQVLWRIYFQGTHWDNP